jgi:aspartyl protease family protein
MAAPSECLAVESLRILGLFSGKAIVLVDGKQHLLSSGDTSPEGVKLISANAREAVIEVDGRRGTYTLGSHISSRYAEPVRDSVTVQVWPDSSGTYRVSGSINGYPVKFIVDTGATTIAMNAPQARRLGIDYRVTGKPTLASTASGIAESYLINLRKVKVGQIELRDMEAAVIDGDHPSEVLLGMNFLGRLSMSREGKMLELKQSR